MPSTPIGSPETTISTRRFLLSAGGGVVPSDRAILTESHGAHAGLRNALLKQVVANRIGALFRKPLIVVVGADTVGVALQLDLQSGIGEQDAGNLGELLAGAGFESVAVEVEQDIVDIDDQATGGFPGLENQVQLVAEALAESSLLGFGLVASLISLLGGQAGLGGGGIGGLLLG